MPYSLKSVPSESENAMIGPVAVKRAINIAAKPETCSRLPATPTDAGALRKEWKDIVAAYSPALLREIYFGLLGREPDEKGRSTYEDLLLRTNELSPILADVVRSDEFWKKSIERRAKELVRQVFLGVLGREPDSEESAACSAKLSGVQDLSTLVSAIALSDEFWEKALDRRSAELVRQLFLGVHGREPDPEEAGVYVPKLSAGRDLAAVVPEIANSDEFWRKSIVRRSDELVRQLFIGVLGREPDEKGLAAYSQLLGRTKKLSSVLTEIIRSDEFWNKIIERRSEEVVRQLFIGVLGREPDQKGHAAYSQLLGRTKKLSSVLAEMLRSDEFWKKMTENGSVRIVRQLYIGILDREPAPDEEAAFCSTAGEKRDAFAIIQEILSTEEFWQRIIKHRADEAVRQIFLGVLGREPEADEKDAHVEKLSATGDLSAVLADVTLSERTWKKMCNIHSHRIVQEVFKGLFGRKPEEKGLQQHVEQFGASHNLAKMLATMVGSQEFIMQFSKKKKLPNPARWFDDPCVVFIHIEKTAGTSIQNHLRDCFGGSKIFHEHEDTLYLRAPGELARFNVFAGHFNYDSLRFIPRQKLSLFTFMREPKKRLYSLYHFLRAHEPCHRNFWLGPKLANEFSIEEFFESPQIRNVPAFQDHMCWAVMGLSQWRKWLAVLAEAGDETASAELIETVMRPAIAKRLEEFAFIGIQEDFDNSVEILFRTVLNSEPPPAVRADHSLELLMSKSPDFKRDMARQPGTARLWAAMEPLIALDKVIYEEGKRLYEERFKLSSAVPQ